MNCGFSDNRYLEAACKRTLGCSVSEYRKRLDQRGEEEAEILGNGLHERFGIKESLKLIHEYLEDHPDIGLISSDGMIGADVQ